MNISKRYFRVVDCDGDHDLYHQKVENVIISSVFFDFFAGFVSLWFTLKLYQCIDIDHPVYSVIFSNNLLSTLLSGFTFIIKVIATQVESCIPNFILIEISGCIFSMNYICWMCIAFLRYYLLVVVKGQNNTNAIDVDMIKLKKMASVCFWGTILGTSIVRFSLDLMRYLQILSFSARNITRSILFLVYPMSTFGIYYKMDVSLEVKNKTTGDGDQIGKSRTSKKSNESIPNQNDHESPAISMANYEVMVGKKLRKTKFDITSKVFFTQNTYIRRKNKIGCMNKISPDAVEKPFGGIYVGDDKQATENDTEDIDISSVTNVPLTAKDNIENDVKSIANIPVDEEIRYLYTSGNEKHSTSIENTNTPENEFEVSKERINLRNKDLRGELLHNERLMKDSTIQAEINSPKRGLIRSLDKRSFKTHGIEEARRPEFQNIETSIVAHPKNHPPDTEINRIDVLKLSEEESATNLSTTARGNGSNDTNKDCNEEEEADNYHESKEHKSIRKAVLINFLYIGLMVIMGGMLSVISQGDISDGVIMTLGLMLSLYRTFAPIISSIYCFDVIRACSLDYLNEKQDNFRAAYNMLRGLCR